MLLQGAKVSLHAVDAHCEAVLQQEVFGVLRQDGRVLSVKCQILADEDSDLSAANSYEQFYVVKHALTLDFNNSTGFSSA